jgi:hypothetical protein
MVVDACRRHHHRDQHHHHAELGPIVAQIRAAL